MLITFWTEFGLFGHVKISIASCFISKRIITFNTSLKRNAINLTELYFEKNTLIYLYGLKESFTLISLESE